MEEKEFSVEYIIENGLDKSAYGFVYITTNLVNGKKYIGQRMFNKGWERYLGSGILLKYSIKKYGKNNFSKKITAITYSKNELDDLEIKFIKDYCAVENNNYYNISHGGINFFSNIGKHFSEEHKLKLSIANKRGNGINHFNYGKKASAETKAKMSVKKRNISEQTRRKLSEAGKKKIFSYETRKKMSESHRGSKNYNYGKRCSDETKQKLREINIGKKHSEESKLKMSKAQKGKIISENTRIKMSDANKGEKHPMFGKHPSEETRIKISLANKGKLISEELKAKISAGNRKINKDQVVIIRDRYSNGKFTQSELAKEYCVSRETINHVINYRGVYQSLITV